MNTEIQTAPFAEAGNKGQDHSRAFSQYMELLTRLHLAIASGDRSLAQQLREEMDEPAGELGTDEMDWLSGLSGDLYALHGEEVFEPNPFTPDEYQRRIQSAFFNREPQTLLTLLRMKQYFLPREKVIYGRSRAYSWLGLYPISLLFLEVVSRQSGNEAEYRVFVLNDVYQAGMFREAGQMIETIFGDPASPPETVLQAAGTLFMIRSHLGETRPEVALGRMRRAVAGILRRLPPGENRQIASFGHILLGMALQGLGRFSQARTAYRAARDISPKDDAPWVLLGQLLYPKEINEAVFSYQQAARLGTNFPVAYIPAAMLAYNTEEFLECISLCQRALEFVNQVPEEPTFRPIAAAANFYLGKSEIAVGHREIGMAHIGEAARLNPDEVTIVDEYREYTAATSREISELSERKRNLSEWMEATPSLSFVENIIAGMGKSQEMSQSERKWTSLI